MKNINIANWDISLSEFCKLTFDLKTQQDGKKTLVILNEEDCATLGVPFDPAPMAVGFDSGLEFEKEFYIRNDKPVCVLSEPTFYMQLLMSDAPTAQSFKSWVTQVVLPSYWADGYFFYLEELNVTPPVSNTSTEALIHTLRRKPDVFSEAMLDLVKLRVSKMLLQNWDSLRLLANSNELILQKVENALRCKFARKVPVKTAAQLH